MKIKVIKGWVEVVKSGDKETKNYFNPPKIYDVTKVPDCIKEGVDYVVVTDKEAKVSSVVTKETVLPNKEKK